MGYGIIENQKKNDPQPILRVFLVRGVFHLEDPHLLGPLNPFFQWQQYTFFTPFYSLGENLGSEKKENENCKKWGFRASRKFKFLKIRFFDWFFIL